MVYEKMTAIANAIRDKTGGTDALTLDDMAAAIPEVYAAGEKSEYDRFWDAYQDNGNRTDYQTAFAGVEWNSETFKPKYDMSVSNAYMMFRFSTFEIYDILDDLGLTIDFKNSSNFQYTFYAIKASRLSVIDISNASYTQNLFSNSTSLKTIEKVICTEKTAFNSTTFVYCSSLENVTFEGVIASGFSVSQSPKLTHDSLMSIINALKTYTSGTHTMELGTTNLAKLTDAEKAIATQKGWTLA